MRAITIWVGTYILNMFKNWNLIFIISTNLIIIKFNY